MEPSLFTNTEINLLIKKAQSSLQAAETAEPAQKVEPFDFQSGGQLSSIHAEKLLALHSGFAAQLAQSWSNLLACDCQVNPKSVEQVAFGDFAGLPASAICFGALRTAAPEARVFLQADLAMVLSMIDLMLGGAGSAGETNRSLTAIEQEIFKPVTSLFGLDLQSAWSSILETSLHLDYYDTAENLLAAGEKVLLVKFDVRIGELSATWILILPSLVSNVLTRKLDEHVSPAEESRSDQDQRLLRERLLNGRFRLELFLPPSKVSMRKLAHLKPGQVVVLKPRATDPIQFNLAGIKLFQASPVSVGNHRGAQIKRALSVVKGKEKETR
jgi:flagellar motor switch protein FliM